MPTVQKGHGSCFCKVAVGSYGLNRRLKSLLLDPVPWAPTPGDGGTRPPPSQKVEGGRSPQNRRLRSRILRTISGGLYVICWQVGKHLFFLAKDIFGNTLSLMMFHVDPYCLL